MYFMIGSRCAHIPFGPCCKQSDIVANGIWAFFKYATPVCIEICLGEVPK